MRIIRSLYGTCFNPSTEISVNKQAICFNYESRKTRRIIAVLAIKTINTNVS